MKLYRASEAQDDITPSERTASLNADLSQAPKNELILVRIKEIKNQMIFGVFSHISQSYI